MDWTCVIEPIWFPPFFSFLFSFVYFLLCIRNSPGFSRRHLYGCDPFFFYGYEHAAETLRPMPCCCQFNGHASSSMRETCRMWDVVLFLLLHGWVLGIGYCMLETEKAGQGWRMLMVFSFGNGCLYPQHPADGRSPL